MQNRIKKQPKKRARVSNKELNYGSIFDNNLTQKVQRDKSPFFKNDCNSGLQKKNCVEEFANDSIAGSSNSFNSSSDQFRVNLVKNNLQRSAVSSFKPKNLQLSSGKFEEEKKQNNSNDPNHKPKNELMMQLDLLNNQGSSAISGSVSGSFHALPMEMSNSLIERQREQ